MKQIKVTFLLEDSGLCRDVFRSIDPPGRYFNRSTETGVWYHADQRGNYCESSHPVGKDIIFEVFSDGLARCLDGNGTFEGKAPFVPFCQFERELARSFQARHPNVKVYEAMKAKLLSLPGGEAYADPHSCRDNWLYALDFGNETEKIIGAADWMKRKYHILAVRCTHKPTGFVFTNYRFRAASMSPKTRSHDLLLYDWTD
ncbi:hypothetical protein [Hungatella hathewayi]|uniref:hypothetical protein n=1 Tax=Hungatella hathewayi TaxID=154046 RepID=UPI0011DE2A5F|nr:hypothetical protein [Hungatella hathewayi]